MITETATLIITELLTSKSTILFGVLNKFDRKHQIMMYEVLLPDRKYSTY